MIFVKSLLLGSNYHSGLPRSIQHLQLDQACVEHFISNETAECIWSNIEKVLGEAGSGLDEIVKIFVFGVGTKRTMGAWNVRERMILGKDPLPCVTSVAVSGLFHPDLLLEIDVIAVTGN